jgi:hypothetical protein
MHSPGHPKLTAVFAAAKLFIGGAAGAPLWPSAPPMNNFG